MDKGDVVKYSVLGLVLIFLMGLMFFYRVSYTGYSIFNQNLITLKEVSYEQEKINIDYVFNARNIIGEGVSTEIWVSGDGGEVKRLKDKFLIKEDIISRNVSIDFFEEGNYSVFIAPSYDLDNFVKKDIFVESSDGLTISNLSDLRLSPGEEEKVTISIRNNKKDFLNNCHLGFTGELSNWIYYEGEKGIASGEEKDFVLDVNVPEGVESGEYSGKMELNCDEANASRKFSIDVSGLDFIEIKNISVLDEGVNVSYLFENDDFIGDDVIVNAWVERDERIVSNVTDKVFINKDTEILESVFLSLEDAAGVHYVYIALDSDLDNFVRESVVLGDFKGTGFAVLNSAGGKMTIYAGFLIIVGVAVLFIFLKHRGKEDRKNKWLLAEDS